MKAKEILDIVKKREELEYCCIYLRNKNKQKKYGKMRFTWFASLLFSIFLFFTLKLINGSEAVVNQFFNELYLSVYLSHELSGSTLNALVINTMFTFMPVICFLLEEKTLLENILDSEIDNFDVSEKLKEMFDI